MLLLTIQVCHRNFSRIGNFQVYTTSTGCTSNASTPVTVLSATTPVLDGPSSICKGSTTQFYQIPEVHGHLPIQWWQLFLLPDC
ncbi:MAG: hypothetical protein IPI53_11315 [Saprospiraceae bacterium]|nr:hypothetical protein [Saprospiraceae bacterium]